MMGPPSKWTGSMNFNAEHKRVLMLWDKAAKSRRQYLFYMPVMMMLLLRLKEGRRMATAFPCTRFIALERRNHIVL